MFIKGWKYFFLLGLISLTLVFSFNSYCQSLSHDSLLFFVSHAPDSIGNDTFDIVEYFQLVTKDTSELVKLFALWIISNVDYDLKKYLKGDMTYTDIGTTLATRKTMCQGYSELLCDMCEWANIECEVIRGFVKGFGYFGKPFETPNHLWNVVYIGNHWKIVDVTWAGGYMNNKGRIPSFVKEIREQYIFANPDSLILTHLPVEQKWQLLKNPISLDKFFY